MNKINLLFSFLFIYLFFTCKALKVQSFHSVVETINPEATMKQQNKNLSTSTSTITALSRNKPNPSVITTPTTAVQPINKPNNSNKNQQLTNKSCKFSMVVLSVIWLEGFCNTSKTYPCIQEVINNWDHQSFLLHGLWPTTEPLDLDCIKQCSDKQYENFNLNNLQVQKSLMNSMLEYWPYHLRVKPNDLPSLWHHEWRKHGTCYSDLIKQVHQQPIYVIQSKNQTKTYRQKRKINKQNQISYFAEAVRLFQNLNIRKLSKNTFTKQEFATLVDLPIDYFYFTCKNFTVDQLFFCFSIASSGMLQPRVCDDKSLDKSDKNCHNEKLIFIGFDPSNQQKQTLNPKIFKKDVKDQERNDQEIQTKAYRHEIDDNFE